MADDCICERLAGARADERENDSDERIHAWEAVATHPTLRPAFDVEGALIPAVLARLTDLGDLDRLITEMKPEARLHRIRRRVLALLHRKRQHPEVDL
jgi:hypothetical protein